MRLKCAYGKRIFTSGVFYLSILGVILAVCSGTSDHDLQYGVLAQVESSLDLGPYRKMILLFSGLPFVSFYAAEAKEKMEYPVLSRSSLRTYLSSHILLCFLTSFLVSFLGLLFSTVILSLKYPLLEEGKIWVQGVTSQQPILQLTQSMDTIWAFCLLKGMIYSVSMGSWSLSGLAVSAVIPNTFVAIVSPLVFSYVLEFFTINSKSFPDLWYLSLCYTNVSENLWISIGYIVGVFLLLGLLFSAVFRIFVTRRVRNEIN